MEHHCSCCCGCYCSLALVCHLHLFAGPCLFLPIVFAPACLPLLGYAGSPLLATVCACPHSFVDPHLSLPVVFALTCLTSSCSWLCLFALVHAHSGSFVLVWLLFALVQPLACACIKYMINTDLVNKLTFIS